MSFLALSSNSQAESDTVTWAKKFFAAVDSRQPDAIVTFMQPDIRLQMGNAPALVGIPAVHAAFSQAAQRFVAIQHSIQGIWQGTWEKGDVVSVEAIVTYTFPDSRIVKLPCTSTLRLQDEKIADYRIFIDPTPAFAD
ncbi:MAG: nuclear transport factor 2 family protein [Leptolyngbya sp. Prado105]|jgi:ketosteroid isomerase-like protein|nr:nuclear transport factor 2 family protein [Leptolyngbya sp. Prado105]